MVRGRLGPRGGSPFDGPQNFEHPGGALPHRSGRASGLGGHLPAPLLPAVQGATDWRCGRVRLPRLAVRLQRPLPAGARARQNSRQRQGAQLSRGPALGLDLDLDGRPGFGRRGLDHRHPPTAHQRMGGVCGRVVALQRQLHLDDRQLARPLARELCAPVHLWHQRGSPVTGQNHPARPLHHGQPHGARQTPSTGVQALWQLQRQCAPLAGVPGGTTVFVHH